MKCSEVATAAIETSTAPAADPIPAAPPATPAALPPLPSHSLAPASCPLRTNDEALSFILETCDTLISPHITHSQYANASLIAIRRNIYSKQFNSEALRLIHARIAPTPSLDELVHIIHLA